MSSDLLIVAGEESGDRHGGGLLSSLLELRPDLRAFGLAGERLVAAGAERIADSAEISVVGLVEVLKVLGRAREIKARLLAEVDRRRPAAAILIDSPGFNLRMARALKQRGIPVIYYISPQVWAWWRGRVRGIARRVDKMLVLFPFEVDFYREAGIDVSHVGHPLVDEVPELPHVWDARSDPESFNIALMPGSRASEVEALLPVLLESAARIAGRAPARLRLLRAGGRAGAAVDRQLATTDLPVEVVRGEPFPLLADSHLALCASGTATLELGLIGTPMLVLYKLAFWTYWAGRALVDLPYVSLVNLVLDERVVPELMQDEANPTRIEREALALLEDRPRIAAMRGRLAGLRTKLGRPGASRRAASEVAAFLAERATA